LRLLIIIAATVVLFLGHISMSPHAGSVASKEPLEIQVFDGNTIQIGNIVYNLVGIDAPELGQVCDANGNIQRCGLTAAYQLRKMLELGKASLKCQRLDVEASGATALASCALGEQDVSLSMLQSGHAVLKPDAPPNYVAAQAQAQEAGLGIWGSTFVPPAEWRQGARLSVEDKEGHEACVIKGISEKGRRVYFGPLDDVYDKIDVAASPEGRTFCSEEEARLAGWRRPLQQPLQQVD
jgi:endonuclease YncB( thermonuclease family)